MPMNDPHVKTVHFYILHDDSVDYSDVESLVHDDALFCIRAEKRNVVLEPKCHYATEGRSQECSRRVRSPMGVRGSASDTVRRVQACVSEGPHYRPRPASGGRERRPRVLDLSAIGV